MHQVSHLAVVEHKDTLKQNNIHRIDDTNIWTPAGGGEGGREGGGGRYNDTY